MFNDARNMVSFVERPRQLHQDFLEQHDWLSQWGHLVAAYYDPPPDYD